MGPELDREELAAQARGAAQERELMARALGGRRALEVYVATHFKATPRTAPAFKAACAFDHRKENIYIHGPTGTGKSWLAAVAARRIFDERFWQGRIRTINEMELSRMVRGCPDANAEEELIKQLGELDVLVLQDLGVAKVTDFLAALIYEVIDYRYQNKPGGLVVTSNLSLDELGCKLGDDRVSDRLAQMTLGRLFSFVGEESRRVPAKEGA